LLYSQLKTFSISIIANSKAYKEVSAFASQVEGSGSQDKFLDPSNILRIGEVIVTKKELIEKLENYPDDVEIGYVDTNDWVEVEDVVLHESESEEEPFLELT